MGKTSSARISPRGSKRGRGGKRQAIQKPFRTQCLSFWVWSCCGCWQHPSMLLSVTARCPGCLHMRCEACPVQRITMMPGKGKSNPELLKDTSATFSERSDVDMDETVAPVQHFEQLEQIIVLPSVVTTVSDQIDHLFEPSTISEVVSAIELDVESHATSPAR